MASDRCPPPVFFADGFPPPPTPGSWSNVAGDGSAEAACAETIATLMAPGGLAVFASGLAVARRDKPEA